MAKRGLCILLAVLTLFSLAVPAFAAEGGTGQAATSGTCGAQGDNVKWSLSSDGTLTISGTGAMEDYEWEGTPWYSLRGQVKKLVINSGVAHIGACAFLNCGALTGVTIPESVTSIGGEAFKYCSSLTSIKLPNSLTSIGSGVFSCSGFTSMTIPAGVTSIADQAFAWCSDLASVTIPSSVTSIGGSAFYLCTGLTNVTIPNGVTSIGGKAFGDCTGLTSLTIPASVTNIENAAFDAKSFTNIYVDKGNKSYTSVDGVLFSADKKTLVCYPQGRTASSYVIPDTVTCIAGTALWHCGALTGVTIPDSVTRIEANAFAGCTGLKSVTIPASVTEIRPYVFEGCGNLASLTVLNPNCVISDIDSVEMGVPGTTVISGYDGSTAEAYAEKYGYTFKSLGKAPDASEPAQLAAPTVKIAQSKSGIGVTWNAVEGSPLYMVYYKENGGGWKKIGTTAKTSYTRAAKYLKAGATYQFAVRCCASDKKTMLSTYEASNKVTYTVELAAPTVKAAQSKSGIGVTWNAVSGSALYMVYYKENGGSWKKIGTTAKTSYTRAAKYLKAGAAYQFAVRCCASDKKTLLSSFKASSKVTYTVELAAPAVKIAQTDGGIGVTWNAVSGSAKYMVYYKENSGGWTKIGTTAKTSYTRAAKYLKDGAAYQFAVRCCAADGKTLLSGYTASNKVTYKK